MNKRVLRVVGVLVLVDEDVPKAPAVDIRNLRERAEQIHGLGDEVVEVERVGALQSSLVVAEDLDEEALGGVAHVRLSREGLGIREFVLELGNPSLHARGGQPESVGFVLFHEALDESTGVAGVVDRERLREPELLGLATQDPHARGVERRDPHPAPAFTDELLDTFAHLTGCLVGERDRENLTRIGLATAQQRRDPVGEHPGLARPRARDDQERRAPVQHRLALRRIQAGQQLVIHHIHNPASLFATPDIRPARRLSAARGR